MNSHPIAAERNGAWTITSDDGEVVLRPGPDLHRAARVAHLPSAEIETDVLLFEPSDTMNIGDNPGEQTAVRRLA